MENQQSSFDYTVMLWLAEKKNYLIAFFATLVLLLFAGIQYMQKSESATEENFIRANKNIALLHEGTNESMDALKELQTIAQKNTDINTSLNGIIAQALLATGDSKAARPYLTRALAPVTKNEFPVYAVYSNLSFCIEEGDLRQALDDSLKMETNNDPLLHVFNQMRIAMLYQKLGEWENEKKAWKTFQELAKDPKVMSLIQTFSQERMPIEPYITHRIQLKN